MPESFVKNITIYSTSDGNIFNKRHKQQKAYDIRDASVGNKNINRAMSMHAKEGEDKLKKKQLTNFIHCQLKIARHVLVIKIKNFPEYIPAYA